MNPTIQTGTHWMQTHTGRRFYPLAPNPADICIEDIAHALSNLCRFGGHVREFYSVAQHSVIVANLLPAQLKLAGLLHDATEAYIVDIPRPLKQVLPEYKVIEFRLSEIICDVFDVDFSDPEIKTADNVALMTEARDLLTVPPVGWNIPEQPMSRRITPMCPEEAEYYFLSAFHLFAQ